MGRHHAESGTSGQKKESEMMRRKRWRRCISKKVAQVINSAEGSAGLLHGEEVHRSCRETKQT